MIRGVVGSGEVKGEESRSRRETESEKGVESLSGDPKPGELPLARVKVR